MKKLMSLLVVLGGISLSLQSFAEVKRTKMMENKIIVQKLAVVDGWDKTFPKSDKVNHRKVTFANRYGITLAADLYEPKRKKVGKFPAIAVSGPFGAVKEQCSGLYAQSLAERGFLAIAFDPSFTGESGGTPRRVASPDINTEDFQAAVDYLSTLPNVDSEKVGMLGICGWGGLALNAAALDTRVKATVAVTMYDMCRVTAKGYFDQADSESKRHQMRERMNAQRTKEYAQGFYEQGGGVVEPLPADAPQFVKDYYDYYKTERGYHPRSGNSNDGWTKTGCQSFLNQTLLAFSKEIRSAVLLIHGEKAHSRYFSEDAWRDMTAYSPYRGNKELYLVPGASHTDLYDGGGKGLIPFDKIVDFYTKEFSRTEESAK